MISQTKAVGLFAALSILVLTGEAQAQTGTNAASSSTDISDQARFVEGLEARQPSDWTFSTGGQNEALVETNDYELNTSEQDVELVNPDEGDYWRSSGDDEDSAVILDVYDF